eukprot:jgi/Hompol1/3650/HPOL_006688-RA
MVEISSGILGPTSLPPQSSAPPTPIVMLDGKYMVPFGSTTETVTLKCITSVTIALDMTAIDVAFPKSTVFTAKKIGGDGFFGKLKSADRLLSDGNGAPLATLKQVDIYKHSGTTKLWSIHPGNDLTATIGQIAVSQVNPYWFLRATFTNKATNLPTDITLKVNNLDYSGGFYLGSPDNGSMPIASFCHPRALGLVKSKDNHNFCLVVPQNVEFVIL